jgi:mono/diheme cytochrome c family protein
MRLTRRAVVAAIPLGILAAGFFFWPHPLEPVSASAQQPTGAALLARGEYLTTVADCEACHTAPGELPFAGGLAFKLPFGTIYSPNITPDAKTGIGSWTDAQFVRALNRGVGRHGEDLYPAFPYTAYLLLSVDDALAIRAYLSSLRPIEAAAPKNDLIFPFNVRNVMRGWRLLFLPTGGFQPDMHKDETWNRGAYLTEALAHCGECHTPRNLLFATKSNAKFAGAVVDGWKAYDITPDASTGIGRWTDAEVATYLTTGHASGHGGANGSMAEAIDLSLRHLDASDAAAIVVYLRTVPPRASALAEPVDENPPALARSTPWSPPEGARENVGLRAFESACASCHGWDGNGQQVDIAALRGARTVNDPQGTNLIRAILNGSHIGSARGDLIMPSFSDAYSDAEIAAVSNYVLQQFGGKSGTVKPADVKRARL